MDAFPDKHESSFPDETSSQEGPFFFSVPECTFDPQDMSLRKSKQYYSLFELSQEPLQKLGAKSSKKKKKERKKERKKEKGHC